MSEKNKYLLLIGSCLMACIIGLLNWFSVPTLSDDVMYRFVWQKDWQLPYERIESLSDVIKSQIIHYEYNNGRSITHGMAQVAINLIHDSLAKIINTGVFLLLIYLITRYTAKGKEYYLIMAAIAFGLLFFVINGFGTSFIWLLGAFTYLWALVITLCFLLMIRTIESWKMSWKLLPLIPLSFLMGWTHEAIALPISCACFFYLFVNRKNIFYKASTYCMLAYMAGMLMIVTSPALWNRADIEGISLLQRIIAGGINLIFNVKISWILIATLLVLLFKNKSHLYDTIKTYQYLFVAWIAALGIVVTCGTSIERVGICADFLAMLIIMGIWQGERVIQWQGTIITLVCILSVIVAIPAIQLSYENYQNYLYHCTQLEDKDNRIIKVRQLPADMNTLLKRISRRYVNPTIEFNYNCVYMAFDQHDINNKGAARLYNKTSVIFLPEEIIDNIYRDSTAYLHQETDEHQNLFIKQVQRKQVNDVTFLSDTSTFTLDDFHYELLNIDNRQYIVMTVPPPSIFNRIRDIRIK